MELWQWFYLDPDGNWAPVEFSELQRLSEEGVVTQDTMVGWQGLDMPGLPFRFIEAEFFYQDRGSIQHLYSEAELHAAAVEGRISSTSKIWGRTLPANGVPYSALLSFQLHFAPSITDFIQQRRGQPTTVLSGPNNSGKTLILKLLRRELGPSADLLACNRFYHLHQLEPATDDDRNYARRHESFLTQMYQQPQNTETSDFPLPQVLSNMKDAQRGVLLELCSQMLGAEFRLRRADEKNELSRYRVEVDDQNLSVASTGTRLLLMMVAACLDPNHAILLIDEPELGLSPRLQSTLAVHLFDSDLRRRFFPHVRQVFIATHSHLFLDRHTLGNNFIVLKTGNEVSIREVDSMSVYHALQFNMLGNSLESLFLPSAIIIVEGPSDEDYMTRLLQLRFPKRSISVVDSGGEGRTPDHVRRIGASLGNLMMSPYRDRIFVLLDAKHSAKAHDFTKYGIPPQNLIILQRNGIEYYYPASILSDVFSCGTDPYSQLQLHDNTVTVADITLTKKELCKQVIARLTAASTLPEELTKSLLAPLGQLLGE